MTAKLPWVLFIDIKVEYKFNYYRTVYMDSKDTILSFWLYCEKELEMKLEKYIDPINANIKFIEMISPYLKKERNILYFLTAKQKRIIFVEK